MPFLAFHVVLGPLVYRYPSLTVLHAIVVLGISLWVALRRDSVSIACMAAYIAGTEVLWRATHVPVPWEIAKYSISILFAIGLIRLGNRGRWRALPILYFVFMVPSVLVLLQDAQRSLSDVSGEIRFHLSGPLALCMGVWFLSQVRLTSDDFEKVRLAFVGPAIALACVTIFATYTATGLTFSDESNMVTSAGFGPNQVAAALGIGAMLAFISAIDVSKGFWHRAIWGLALVLCAVQSAMTFSRGGLYVAGLGILAGVPFLFTSHRIRRRLLAVSLLVAGIGAIVVVPRLQEFTGGALASRFTDTDPTNRGALIEEDLRIWSEHPILGVGPGASRSHRVTVIGSGHTEYSRLLAEHGMLGFVSLILLCVMAAQVVFAPGNAVSRGVRVMLLTAAMLSMMTAATRIAAFSLLFGLSHVNLEGFGFPKKSYRTSCNNQKLRSLGAMPAERSSELVTEA